MKYVDEFKNPLAAKSLAADIRALAARLPSGRAVKIMEVCGSHTMAIARYALRDFLPENVLLTSGPGCPVCVTDSGYIDAALELAARPDVTLGTFGDMMRVPGGPMGNGKRRSLSSARAEGADVRVCYSPAMALEAAVENPAKEVVFLAIGFETTAAPIAATLNEAVERGIGNFSLLTAFKLVPPALEALASDPETAIDAFLCPAHVSAIIGSDAYKPFVEKHHLPCVVAGFEPLDILFGIKKILEQVVAGSAFVDNQYARVVRPAGNPLAWQLVNRYFEVLDAPWRGIGVIAGSGMGARAEFAEFDTERKLKVDVKPGKPDPRCKCGEVLKGKIQPAQCPMFAKACVPSNPIGPCMVSSEGACAAQYKYSRRRS
jgi:hydrogenase expression/formation protein HypD